jgi:hypothetical protein
MWVQLAESPGNSTMTGYYKLDSASNLEVFGPDTDSNYFVHSGGAYFAPAYSSAGDAQGAMESLVATLGVVTLPAAS